MFIACNVNRRGFFDHFKKGFVLSGLLGILLISITAVLRAFKGPVLLELLNPALFAQCFITTRYNDGLSRAEVVTKRALFAS